MKPCKECPFKKGSVAGWLGPYKTALQFIQDSFQQDGMACHMAVENDQVKPCVGSLHCANKSAKQFQGDLLEAQLWVKDDTDAADQCMTAPEFIKYHQRRRGRKRALTDEQVVAIRRSWSYNIYLWQVYRMNPALSEKPINLSMTDLAVRHRVSQGVIQHVIDRKGAYSE